MGFVVSKVSEQRQSSDMVVETRSQELATARREKASVTEETPESRFEKIENKLDAQNAKIERHISEMFEAINMLSASKQPFPPENHHTPRFSYASASDCEQGRQLGNVSDGVNWTG